MYRFILIPLAACSCVGLAWYGFDRLLPESAAAQPPVGPDFQPPGYRGRVEQITEKTVTIKLVGYLQFNEIWYTDGIKYERKYVQDNNQPPMEFVFHQDLIPRPDGLRIVQRGHSISDLRVGDVIQIGCSRWRGIDYCCVIEIHRRPGGKV